LNKNEKGAKNPALAVLARQGFRFKKELGQHFLFNTFVLEQIADSAGITSGDAVVEAGAGAGSLTAVLAERGAKVYAVELDRSLIPYLESRFQGEPLVSVIRGDVMKLDHDALAGPSYKICANLPYHISTAFVTMAFRRMKGLTSGAVLLQKETADRVTALPGEERYGPLALAAAWFGEVRQVVTLGPEYFTPPPPVDSTVIAFRRQPHGFDADEKVLWQVIRGLFTQRRKTLANGLKSLAPYAPRDGRTWAEILEETGVDHRRRPETLALGEFAAIVTAAGYIRSRFPDGCSSG